MTAKEPEKNETLPDAWARFERAVRAIVKSSASRKAKPKKRKGGKAKSSQ